MTLDTSILAPQTFKPYVDRFNADDVEDIVNLIPNAVAWDWMQSNVPLNSRRPLRLAFSSTAGPTFRLLRTATLAVAVFSPPGPRNHRV